MVGRLAVVTGGAGGIGRAISDTLAAAGHEVVAFGRDEAALHEFDEHAARTGRRMRGLRCDVTDEDAVGAALDSLGPVDILVNNAGVSASAPLARTGLQEWNEQLLGNATSAFLLTRGVLPAMRNAGWGRVVFIASTSALVGAPYTAAYTAAKHAMLGLARTVAAEVAGSGVTANSVCPTFVRTPMTERSVARIVERTGRDRQRAQAALAEQSPLGRLLEPDEIAAAVEYLVGERAGCVNGQSLVLDGGGLQR